jgi:hypothetical protein
VHIATRPTAGVGYAGRLRNPDSSGFSLCGGW